jgi:hypothetical protein
MPKPPDIFETISDGVTELDCSANRVRALGPRVILLSQKEVAAIKHEYYAALSPSIRWQASAAGPTTPPELSVVTEHYPPADYSVLGLYQNVFLIAMHPRIEDALRHFGLYAQA